MSLRDRPTDDELVIGEGDSLGGGNAKSQPGNDAIPEFHKHLIIVHGVFIAMLSCIFCDTRFGIIIEL